MVTWRAPLFHNAPWSAAQSGLNDPRVSSWLPAKFAATLRTAGPTEPVLFRIDEKAGHGIGSTKTQNDELYADVVTFILARSGKGEAPNK